jgi:phosphohistidine phosphatase
MAYLILLRHAKAESASSTGRDIDRALTERGHRDAAIMGRVLSQAGFVPDLALVSTARRAQETWEEASPAFPGARLESSRGLYLASREHLTQVVQDNLLAGALMIVGHNPGLHEFALSRSAASPAAVRLRIMEAFPTAAAAVFSVEPNGALTLQEMIHPRDHGGGVL